MNRTDIFMLVDESHRTNFGIFSCPDAADVPERLLPWLHGHAADEEREE